MKSRGSVLIIDDEINICRILDASLSRFGFSVSSVSDGADALAMVKRRRYDTVILDLVLPSLDGLSTLRELQQIDNGIPVIVITASDSIEARESAMKGGASAFLGKPFDLNSIVSLVRHLVSEGRSIPYSRLPYGGYTLFYPGQKVLLGTVQPEQELCSGSILEYNPGTIRIQLEEDTYHASPPGSAPVIVSLPGEDALYRFFARTEDDPRSGEIDLSLPSHIYRIQRRKQTRLQVKAPMVISWDEPPYEIEGITEDAGATGISFISMWPVSEGMKVRVKGPHLLNLKDFESRGTVVNSIPMLLCGEQRWRLGIQFSAPHPQLRRAIITENTPFGL